MNHWSEQRTDLKASLEHLKKYLRLYFLSHPPMELQPGDWAAWVDWNLPDINHAIDHIITDHEDDSERLQELEGIVDRTEFRDKLSSQAEVSAKSDFYLQSAQQNGHERDCLFQALKHSTFYCSCPDGRMGEPPSAHGGQCSYRHAMFHLGAAAKTMEPLRAWLEIQCPELSLETTIPQEKP